MIEQNITNVAYAILTMHEENHREILLMLGKLDQTQFITSIGFNNEALLLKVAQKTGASSHYLTIKTFQNMQLFFLFPGR